MRSIQDLKNRDSVTDIIIILGATATGKSRLAVDLASALDGEVINADSKQIYRSMDIGTAKPNRNEMRDIPHHLYDIKNPDDYYSAADFVRDADAVIKDISKREKVPIVAGGTGMYIKALLMGLFDGTDRNEEIREKLEDVYESKGQKHLHKMLMKVDPASAERVNSADRQRTVRALEVFFEKGVPMSSLLNRTGEERYKALKIGLTIPRNALYDRINKRAKEMVRSGFIDEVRGLLKRGSKPESNAFKALGYHEIKAYIDGNLSLEESVEFISQRTRNYAKRQLTWFKKESDVTWFNAESYEDLYLNALSLVRSEFNQII